MTGTEVARALRDARYERPIVLFSAYIDPQIEVEATGLRLITLAKSDINQLAEVVREALDAT